MNAHKEGYSRGYTDGFEKGYAKGHRNGVRDKIEQSEVLFNARGDMLNHLLKYLEEMGYIDSSDSIKVAEDAMDGKIPALNRLPRV